MSRTRGIVSIMDSVPIARNVRRRGQTDEQSGNGTGRWHRISPCEAKMAAEPTPAGGKCRSGG
jgi:hypothetical protein